MEQSSSTVPLWSLDRSIFVVAPVVAASPMDSPSPEITTYGRLHVLKLFFLVSDSHCGPFSTPELQACVNAIAHLPLHCLVPLASRLDFAEQVRAPWSPCSM